MIDSVNVLGTVYSITKKDADEMCEQYSYAGYCDPLNQEIVIYNMNTFRGWENESEKDCIAMEKQNLRHEIIHAFLYESGLWDNSDPCDAWAKNEEMVDWLALQGLKIFIAWKEADAL